MTLPQHLTYGKGGTVHIVLDQLPSSVSVSITDGDDSEQLAHTAATVSSIDACLVSAANAGNSLIVVNSNTGMSCGSVAWLRGDPEEILVREVAGTTVHLRRPLVCDHISGEAVQGGRCCYAVNAEAANTLWWDGRAEWNVLWSNGTSVHKYTAVECTRYPNARMASVQDVYDCDPMFRPGREVDVERLLDNAHEMVLSEIAARAPDQRARVFTGSMEFRRVTAAAAMYLHHLPRSGDGRETWWTEFERRLESVVTTTPRDADQDGEVEASERMSTRVVRARR